MKIRKGAEGDASEGSKILIRSIIELCEEDHASDPLQIAAWTANKTQETWLSWVHSLSFTLFVAEEDGRICGVCMMSDNEEILLNYVSPDARFRGVSKAMLQHMESNLRARGIRWSILESTKTAFTFYRSTGYDPFPDTLPGSLKLRKRLVE